MGINKRRLQSIEPPVVKEEKQPQKVVKKPKVVEVQKPVVKKAAAKKVVEQPKAEETPSGSSKREWDGIGLIGNHPELNKFKGVCKMNGMKVGEQLLIMIKAFNERNK